MRPRVCGEGGGRLRWPWLDAAAYDMLTAFRPGPAAAPAPPSAGSHPHDRAVLYDDCQPDAGDVRADAQRGKHAPSRSANDAYSWPCPVFSRPRLRVGVENVAPRALIRHSLQDP